MSLAPGPYVLSAELTGFTRVERPLTVTADGAKFAFPRLVFLRR